MFREYVKTLPGIVTLAQVIAGLLCQLVIQLLWTSDGLVFIFYILVNPFETIVYFLLFGTTMVTLAAFVMESSGSSLTDTFGKKRVLLYHGLCLLLLLISAGIQTFNITHTVAYPEYYARFIIGDILLFALCISHIFLSVLLCLRR